MHSRQIKAFFMVFILTVSFVFGGGSVFAEGSVYISKHNANNGKSIYPGDKFDLELQIKNESADIINDVWISFGSNSGFQPSDGGRDKPFADYIGGIPVTKTFNMIYTGGTDKNLPITITYRINGQTETVNTSIWIDNAIPEAKSSSPVLELSSGSIPEGKAGGTLAIPLKISNTGKREAREIKVTPALPENLFSIDQMTVYETIEKIPAGKSADINFKFAIDKNAKAGTYKIPLKIEYTDADGVDYPAVNKDIYVKITEENLPAKLIVREAKTNPEFVRPGETFVLTFKLWNMGTLKAENVNMDLKLGSDFSALDNLTSKFLFELNGLNDTEIKYNLKARDDLKSGTYTVTLVLEYGEQVMEYPLYIIVEGEDKEEGKADIITENVQTPQQEVLTEELFTISFDVKNEGSAKAKDIKISVDSGDKILPKSLNVINITSLEPGESFPVSFSFTATEGCESRAYPIKAVIEYQNGDESVKKEQYMGVVVNAEKDEKAMLNTVPKIIISQYSMEPTVVKAGENFTLNLTFLNTSKVKAVENMKINLVVDEKSEETGGSVFTPVQSSNTFYIDRLAPGEKSQKQLVMYTIPDALAKTYVVTAVFEYEYEEDGQLKTNKMEDVFGIPVIQPAKLEVTDVIVSEPAYVGEPLYISSEFYNMGKVKLSNLMVKVEGDFDTRESNYFVGNFDIGASDYYEASITPLQAGEAKGKVVYTFEDAAGEEHRIEKEFTVNVMEAEAVMNPFPGDYFPEDTGMNGEMGQKTYTFPVVPVIIGVVVLAGVIILIVVLKRRKKKKELMLDENI